MAIEKMKAVTLVGQLEDFDRVAATYMDGRDIHLENAIVVLENKGRLFSYEEDNRHALLSKNVLEILNLAGVQAQKCKANISMSLEQMQDTVVQISEDIEIKKHEKLDLEKKIRENELVIKQLDAMIELDIDLTKLFELEFIEFRFGRISRSSYNTLVTYLGNIEAVFIQTAEDENDVWGFYFLPRRTAHKIDAIFSSLYFERIRISDKVVGTPKQSKQLLLVENKQHENDISKLEADIHKVVNARQSELSLIYHTACAGQRIADIKKYSAHSTEFFYIIGWMPEHAALKLEEEVRHEESVILIEETPEQVEEAITPPTKLKNIGIFRPFEMFVKMYSLPAYKEVDPTPILAITYILLFGIMFGDVGQSAVFAVIGFLIYKFKKSDLAAMISMVGVSGTVFGFIYGSVFGNETVLEHVRLLEPMQEINFMLIGAVLMGVFLIIFCMVMNVINSVRMNDWGRALFCQNGIAGLVFYVTLMLLVVGIILGMNMPIAIMVTLLVITFVVMYMQEPLTHLIQGRKDWIPKEGIFYVQSFFEMFDILLSFVTNTISFLRVGAFAIIHVGMMLAVSVLAGDGAGSIVVVIIGNIVVMGLEGLIVGIQVLRLEYYEMFSRYFSGNGKPFQSLRK